MNVEDIGEEGSILKIHRRSRRLEPLSLQKVKRRLELRARGIVVITPHISAFTRVTVLDLSDNHLIYLPDQIGALVSLERLLLAGNNIQFLPEAVGSLHHLRILNLERNYLTTLPTSLRNLKSLRILNLGHNFFKSLPTWISELPKLTFLFLQNNYDLRMLPSRLSLMQRLHIIDVMGCDMINTAEQSVKYSLDHSNPGTPSLLEWCLRGLLLSKAPQAEISKLPMHLQLVLREDPKVCDYCNGPYFWHSTTRCRIVAHTDDMLCMEYKLCCSHWNSEKGRVKRLFHQELEPLYDASDWILDEGKQVTVEHRKRWPIILSLPPLPYIPQLE
jgi:hypothetical protein